METKIYGHRGCMGIYPENTMISFKKAIEQGVDGLEIDVHMTSDGEIVVIHDEKLDRTTDGMGYIKNLSLAEIKEYSAGAKFPHFPHYDQSWELERVPTLQELLEFLAPYDIELNIELKTYLVDYEGIEEKVLKVVKQYGNNRNVIYSSFHLPTLVRMKKLDPSSKIALLYEHQLPHPNDYIQTFDMEGLHISKRIVLMGNHYLKNLNGNIRVWTVNDEYEIMHLLDLGVDAIISDYPEKALRIRNARKLYT
ncbi:glycerophosphodiester phosphodiesterase [Lederbergia wuyishanensis]|uniref:Glycerophosphoryl diester phosphodiesterase n=1 Tax=Lederbergia wuyishanensis TaxID=1347903 RepID=A0ABU0D9T8_9BACI|nr:glycerophosphodiester phosphodiesterase [Lederbergia wuyishanensis]MCJ8007430.1 glycerophosphodiester phosphodiesterase [Lederbergia wuyishanensis]MDQ0345132.1 glycerophosphoryl diester phosphodiesterase [Lederbergia wuyishanensis]